MTEKRRNSYLERLKSPVVWSVMLTTLYTQLELWQASSDVSLKTIVLGILMIVIATFGAVNNPADRDNL